MSQNHSTNKCIADKCTMPDSVPKCLYGSCIANCSHENCKLKCSGKKENNCKDVCTSYAKRK